MNSFTTMKQQFDELYKNKNNFTAFVPVNTKNGNEISIKNTKNKPNEEYYKWQFIYSIVYSGMYPKDNIGTEVYFPKGNKNSAPIKFDGAIFDDSNWFEIYTKFREKQDQGSLDWLRKHLIGVIEFKNEDSRDVETNWNQQLKPALKESEKEFAIGIYYDTERLYLFRKYNGKYLRLSDDYNLKGEDSLTKDLSLHLTDPYINLPDYEYLLIWTHPKEIERTERSIFELEIISGLHSKQINDAMSDILRTMDKQGMVNQTGYELLIQILTLKIFDEKRNERYPQKKLKFYITDEEMKYKDINDTHIQTLIDRISQIRKDAQAVYTKILKTDPLDTKNENHIKILIEVLKQFQDYSFVRSTKTDLYQLVFYKFATPFSKEQNAQFVTPLPLIDFLVTIVNPRNGETVVDPTVGIADFLSVSFVNSNSKLDDNNIFGVDIDDQMIMLATLNMLLNGDGNAKLASKPGYGSILSKFDIEGNLIDLVPKANKKGDWENRFDGKKLMKFDVVLTNPPFGEDRAFRPKTAKDLEVIECYELWHRVKRNIDTKTKGKKIEDRKWIDLGLVFLENAYRILKENGRLGIVLSNSLASIDRWQEAREWLLKNMRIVAVFDLPSNVFAETGVNTTLIVAYKPTKNELEKLHKSNYEIFFRDIKKVGYEIRTSKRVKKFEPIYKINYKTFEIEIDKDGSPILDEEFSDTIIDFRQWCNSQEKMLKDLFIKEK